MFSGIGAETYGGRFNSPGTKAIYAAGSMSLGILELVVQSNKKDRLLDLVYATVTFDSDLVTKVDEDDLPEGWDSKPATSVSQEFGDKWIQSAESVVLRIPSVVVPGEYNYVLNPSHPEFGKVELGNVVSIDLDSRLTH